MVMINPSTRKRKKKKDACLEIDEESEHPVHESYVKEGRQKVV